MSGIFDDVIIKEEEDEGKGEPQKERKETIERQTTHVAFVIDRSGSMMGKEEFVMGSFNEQLKKIKSEADDVDSFVTVIRFDNNIEVVHEDVPVDELGLMDDYDTGNTTALNDSIVKAISILGNREEITDDKNHSALVIVITDGYENASKEFKGETGRKALKKIIKELEDTDKWTFVFMGGDIDVQKTAVDGLAFACANTMSFKTDKRGFKHSSDIMTKSLDGYYNMRKTGVTATKSFVDNSTDEDKTAAEVK